MSDRKKYRFFLFLICLILSLSVYASSPEKFPEERALGDKAFNDGLYDLAVKFYNEYRKKAEGNTDAELDAGECLISTYIFSGNSHKAREEFNALTTKFATVIAEKPELRRKMTYWDACITMNSGNNRKAEKILNALISTVPDNSELYFKILDAMGTAQARSLEWDRVEKTYAILEFAGKDTKWARLAIKRRLLAIIMMGDFRQAKSMINQSGKSGKIYIELIKGILLLREGYINKAMNQYREIRKSAGGMDALWYSFASSLGDAFMENKEYKNALYVMNDALIFATCEYERQKALIVIINAAAASGNIKAATKTAERFLKNYPESFVSNEIRLRLASFYAMDKNPDKNPDDALQVLLTLINDEAVKNELKIKSAREAAHIYIKLKRYSEAEEMFKYLLQNGADSTIKGEGGYWIAELKYIQGEYLEAANLFADTAKKYKSWKIKAWFKEIKSLMNTSEFERTVLSIQGFLKENPKSPYTPNVAFLYALSLKNAGRKKDAEAQFAKFAKLYPRHSYAPRSLFEEGLLAMEFAEYDRAVSAFTQLIKKYPANDMIPNVLYRRLYALFWEGFVKEAIADVKTLESKYPDSKYTVHALFKLVNYYVEIEDNADAIVTLQRMMKIYEKERPDVEAKAGYKIADLYYKNGNSDKAIEALDRLSAKFADGTVANYALFLRAEVYTQKDDYEKAIPFYLRVLNDASDVQLKLSALGRIGDCYFALGKGTNYVKAIKYYTKVLSDSNVTPFYRDQALYKIGRTELLLGDKGKALMTFNKVRVYYDLAKSLDRATARSSVWFAKSAIAAANIYLEKDNPESAEAAISIYQSLIRIGLEPKNDFIKKIDLIREKYKLKE